MKALKSDGTYFERNLSDVPKFDNGNTDSKGQVGDQAEEGRAVRLAEKVALRDPEAQTVAASKSRPKSAHKKRSRSSKPDVGEQYSRPSTLQAAVGGGGREQPCSWRGFSTMEVEDGMLAQNKPSLSACKRACFISSAPCL